MRLVEKTIKPNSQLGGYLELRLGQRFGKKKIDGQRRSGVEEDCVGSLRRRSRKRRRRRRRRKIRRLR
jgi:hypothetical protein